MIDLDSAALARLRAEGYAARPFTMIFGAGATDAAEAMTAD
jgi:hypothetical protein